MDNVNLSHSRYSRLIGEIGTLKEIEVGVLNVTLTNSLEKVDSAAVAHVKIDVLAIPKGSKNFKDYAFKLGITVEGIYEGELPPDPTFSEDFRLSLSQPLYTMGVVELRDLAQKLGFPNIHLPWDIAVLSQKSKQTKPAIREAKPPKKALKLAAKKTAERG